MSEWLYLGGGVIYIVLQFGALVVGMSRFKTWLQTAIVAPYIEPIRSNLQSMKDEQTKIYEGLRGDIDRALDGTGVVRERLARAEALLEEYPQSRDRITRLEAEVEILRSEAR